MNRSWTILISLVFIAACYMQDYCNQKIDHAALNSLFQQAVEDTKDYRFEQAMSCYKQILQHYPTSLSTLKNSAHVSRYQGNMRQAATYYKRALQHSDDSDLHYGLAEAQLALGNFKEGWHEFEWRYKRGEDTRAFTQKLWDGSSLHNKTILIRAEYGQGDLLQFIRYLPLLKKQGATIILEAHHSLLDLVSLCPYIDRVIPVCPHGTPNLFFDVQIPIMSLPERFRTNSEHDIPCTIPYLFAKQELVEFWREKIKDDNHFKIGICWDPSPYYEQFKSPLSRKSVPLTAFTPLAALSSISLYSLQKMNGLDQLHELPHHVHIKTFENFDTSHGRFMDTAALIKNLDLVITVDTSIAHLAGALGKPVWVLLPFVADWRWMINRTDSPWYPTMRLFRQDEPGNWQTVIDHIYHELLIIVS